MNPKALIIGTGVGLRTHYASLSKYLPDESIGLISRNISNAKKVTKNSFGFYSSNLESAILEWRPDLIFVGIPTYLHLEIANQLKKTSAIIVFEKPVGINYNEAKLISSVLNSSKTIVNFQLRGLPVFQEIQKIIQTELGKLAMIQITERSSAFINPVKNWHFEEIKGGGQCLSMMPHLIDLSRFLLGSAKNTFVYNNTSTKKLKHTCAMQFFDGDIIVNLNSSSLDYGPRKFAIEIIGTKGNITFIFEGGKGYCKSITNKETKIICDFQDTEQSIFKIAMNSYMESIISQIKGKHTIAQTNIRSPILACLKDAVEAQKIIYKSK